jgi:3D-(3,5/4)-trihydroxycyclohexane-1,2-dione acylhydrolase (decyclizing)
VATKRITVGQALVEFLANQWTVDGDTRVRTIAGTFGIFGHGNVAGVGQALQQLSELDPTLMPYHQARNEQAMVHQAVAYARMNRRLSTFACAASVGPGATNMLTGAALATINRLPALLLPSDTFANRRPDPVLQQLEAFHDGSISVNDAFKPLSRYFDRIQRPEQLFSSALNAMRVLTDPVETGAVTLALPQDVQTEALDVPEEFLQPREWRVRRPGAEETDLRHALELIKSSKAPLIVAGGGVIYSDAHAQLEAFAERTGIPVSVTQAGVGALPWNHPQNLGAIGATGTSAANEVAAAADLVIGIGTRYSDFTTGSRSAFQNPAVKFLNINIASFDSVKLGSSLPMVADAREALAQLVPALSGFRVTDTYRSDYSEQLKSWHTLVDESFLDQQRRQPSQTEIIGAVNSALAPRDTVVCAAGSLPGDLHKLWRVSDSLGYHVEYGYSCMGYEIAGGIGAARADKSRDVVVMVGDGSYLMMHTEIVTAVAEGIKVIIVLIQNHGYASIGNLSEKVGSNRYGTKYRFRDNASNGFDSGDNLPVDLAANAESLGIEVIRIAESPAAISELTSAVQKAKLSNKSTLIHINSDPNLPSPSGGGWWDVPVAEVSSLESTNRARSEYEQQVSNQRPLLGPSAKKEN